MALGDVVAELSTVASNGVLSIKPYSTDQWVIHNLYYGGAVEIYLVNGVNTIKFDSDATMGARLGAVFHVTSEQYLQIKNVSGASTNIAFDGIQTK